MIMSEKQTAAVERKQRICDRYKGADTAEVEVMSDRPQKAWHPDVRYITFSFADGRITVFKSALEDLHWPAFYRFLYNSSEKQFAIQACKEEAPGSHRSPRLKLGDSCEIKSKALVRLLYRDGRWEIAHSYRVPGRIVTEQNLIEFDLRQAIQLERKETNTAATEKNAG